MKIAMAMAAAMLSLGFAQEAGAEKPRNDTATLEKKLHGEWFGEGLCVGDLTLRADGTYEQKCFGPSRENLAGVWEVRWDSLPPTLVLTCKTSDFPRVKSIGVKTEGNVIKLDDQFVEIKYSSSETPIRYSRTKK